MQQAVEGRYGTYWLGVLCPERESTGAADVTKHWTTHGESIIVINAAYGIDLKIEE